MRNVRHFRSEFANINPKNKMRVPKNKYVFNRFILDHDVLYDEKKMLAAERKSVVIPTVASGHGRINGQSELGFAIVN